MIGVFSSFFGRHGIWRWVWLVIYSSWLYPSQ